VITERYVVEGDVNVGAEQFPYRFEFEQSRTARPLKGCHGVPQAQWETVEKGALFKVADSGGSFWHFLGPRHERLLPAALRAEREGDLDRAASAFALLLEEPHESEARALAERWFDQHFGRESSEKMHNTTSAMTGVSVSEIGLAVQLFWPPSS
jgi:hypothetical protein